MFDRLLSGLKTTVKALFYATLIYVFGSVAVRRAVEWSNRRAANYSVASTDPTTDQHSSPSGPFPQPGESSADYRDRMENQFRGQTTQPHFGGSLASLVNMKSGDVEQFDISGGVGIEDRAKLEELFGDEEAAQELIDTLEAMDEAMREQFGGEWPGRQ